VLVYNKRPTYTGILTMKTLFILTFILILPTAHADFIEAQKNYDQGNFKAAYKEFHKLAKLGNIKSQFNVAVMLAKGQGTEKNLVEAYAWSKLVSREEYSKFKNILSSELSEPEKKQANVLYENEISKYAFEKSKIILGPINTSRIKGKVKRAFSVVLDKKFPPQYPRNLAASGIHGWVKLLFNLYPDNSVRDIQVVESFPNKGFDKEAIKSVERMVFHFEENGQAVNVNEPIAAFQRIDFKLKGKPQEISVKQKMFLDKIKAKAHQGDVISQYQYAAIQDRYLLTKDVDSEQINQWLFNASQEGIADAQYRLGRNIYYGKDCKVEKQKGLDWIMLSAQMGNAYAQYMAYQMLQNKTVINPTNEPPIYWLQQAAKNGLSIAQLNYAKEIAYKKSPSKEQIEVAKDYIKNYAKEGYKTIQWYQISALIDDKAEKHKQALSKLKTAIKQAKNYGWDTTELEQQKLMVQQRKS